MFHHELTLHHRRVEMTAFSAKEKRIVHFKLSEWMATKKLQSKVFMQSTRGFRRILGLPFLPVTWPTRKAVEYTVKGANATVDGARWSGIVASESAKGAATTVGAPIVMPAWSRLVAVKRFMVDVPLASVKAAVKTPLGILASPYNALISAWEAVGDTRKNVSSLLSGISSARLGETIKSTRKTLSDLFLRPVGRTLAPIALPIATLLGTAAGAELQTLSHLNRAVTHYMPAGVDRIRNAPTVASTRLALRRQIREANKAALEQKKAEEEAMWEEKVAEYKGEPVPGKAGGGAGSPGMMKKG